MERKSKIFDNIMELFSIRDIKSLDKTSKNYSTYEEQKNELEDEQIPCYSLNDFLSAIKNSKNYNLLISNLSGINKDAIYKSDIHGIYHNFRVALLSFFMAEKLHFNKKDLQLSLYAAFYHDIGRDNDLLDRSHGERSAQKLGELHLNVSNDELTLLKTIITAHCLPDEQFDSIALKNNIKDYERAKRLFYVLKDADGLDRVRLEWPYVKANVLRNPVAKRLILTAYTLEHNFNSTFEK